MSESISTQIPGLGLTEISRDGDTWHLVMRGVTLESTVAEMIWWGSAQPEGVAITNTLVRDGVLEPGQQEPHDIGYFDMTGVTSDAVSHMHEWFPQWFEKLGGGTTNGQEKFDAKLAQHKAKFDTITAKVVDIAKDELDPVIDNLQNTALHFATFEYGEINTRIKAPKKHDSNIGSEISLALENVILAAVPGGVEAKVAAAIAKEFVKAAITHLQTVPSHGVDAEAVRGELTAAVDSLSAGFHAAIEEARDTKHGVRASVEQYLREYLATSHNFDDIPDDDATCKWFAEQIHITDWQLMDPSDALYYAADLQLQEQYMKYEEEVKWEELSQGQRVWHLQEVVPTGRRRDYLIEVGEDPEHWLLDGTEEINFAAVGLPMPY